ncbi:MAG TPA: hypothetical protein VLH35_06370 [Candidatus Acidoferrales bacterium]|nr:hypothetical protein [Candidatus Acidoferrales bacterium]
MKKTKKIASLILIVITVVAAIAFLTNALLTNTQSEFYVGVTYCGSSAQEAKQLIDKVKNYTNLFVLQSGTVLQANGITTINDIGDYAVDSGLHYIIYFGTDSAWIMQNWLDSYDNRWGSNFLGIYLSDEPGGKMLEGFKGFSDPITGAGFSKNSGGLITSNINNASVYYSPDGSIKLTVSTPGGGFGDYRDKDYYLNGTVTVTTYKGKAISEGERVTEIESIVAVKDNSTLEFTYQELNNSRPFKNDAETAQLFIDNTKTTLDQYGPRNYTYLTSDYGLYWYDYQSGYDTILAQFRWNESITQDIALARGAAQAFGKDWGAIITWKYDQPPYLPEGEELYQKMCTAYENGATYVVVFNYAANMTGAYGTLSDEHFEALERFWKEEVKNPDVKQGSVKAEAVFVLPKDFGSGLRSQKDTIWGLWSPTEEQQQIWLRLQNALAAYGQKLDVAYDDSAYLVTGKYSQVIYWNQTS